MKRVLLFLFLIIPFSVFADTVKLTCPDEIASGEEFTCSIEGNTDKIVTSLVMNARFGSDLKMISFVPDGNWQGDGAGGDITLYTADDMVKTFKIGTLKLRNNGGSNNSIIIDEIEFFYDDDSYLELGSITKNIKIKSNTSNSSNNKNDTNIGNTKIDNNNDKKNETKNDETTNKGEDKKKDDVDNIDSTDNTDNTVYRNTYLIDIKINNYDISFDKDIYEYELTIKDEDKLDIEPMLMDNSSKYSIIGNNKLKNGSVIEIKVIAENNDKKTYKIKINKKDDNNNNNKYQIIFIGIIGILVIINIIRIVSRRRK